MYVTKIPIVKRTIVKSKFREIHQCSTCNGTTLLRTCVKCIIKELKDQELYDKYVDCKHNFNNWKNKSTVTAKEI